jgi:hypothetical protein
MKDCVEIEEEDDEEGGGEEEHHDDDEEEKVLAGGPVVERHVAGQADDHDAQGLATKTKDKMVALMAIIC